MATAIMLLTAFLSFNTASAQSSSAQYFSGQSSYARSSSVQFSSDRPSSARSSWVRYSLDHSSSDQFSTRPSSPDLILWYTAPAEKWTDALPVGNGRLGAMIYGGVEKDVLQFNEETLWTGGPRDYNRKGAYRYLPEIRRLLFEGKRAEAEQLAGEQFMGLKSDEGNREKWFKEMRKLPSGNKNPASPAYNDKDWAEMQVPTPEGWERAGFEGLDGAVWFRTGFELPANWAGKDLVLDLGRIRDQDFSYVNGKLVGSINELGKGRV
jgi:alpha-L-fucosidase 2